MTGLWVGLGVPIEVADVRAALEPWFPRASVDTLDSAPTCRAETWPPIVFGVAHHLANEFRTVVELVLFPGPQDEPTVAAVTVELARRFAETLGCDTVCDGSHYGDDRSPFWLVLWRDGQTYLADDSGLGSMDEPVGGRLELIRPLTLAQLDLDDAGLLHITR